MKGEEKSEGRRKEQGEREGVRDEEEREGKWE